MPEAGSHKSIAPPRSTDSPVRQYLRRYVPDSVWDNWKWDVLAFLLAGVYQGAVWTFALQLARGTLHATGNQVGLATAAPAIGVLFAAIWARQMEGKPRLPFVTITWLIARGMFMLTPLVVQGAYGRSAYLTLICLTPIIFSVSVPAYTFVMQDIYPDELRGRLMSYGRITFAGAMLLSAAINGFLQQHGVLGHQLDFRWMFFVGGLFGAGSAWAFSHIKVPPVDTAVTVPPFKQFFRETYSVLIHNRAYRWFTISVFIGGFGNLVATTYYPVYQVDRFHITPLQIAGIQNVTGVSMLISLFFWGWYMDRFGSLAAIMVSYIVLLLMPLCYAFGPTIGWLFVAAALGGSSTSGIDLGYLNATLMFAEPGRAGQYQAVHSSFFGLRGSIAPLVANRMLLVMSHTENIQCANWRLGFEMSFVIMLVGVVCQIVSMRSYRASAAEALRGKRTATR
jgi:MFS family permease